jgi:hypothetical protein
MDTEEINEIMSRNYAVDDIDEDELEAELNDLDNEMFEENMQGHNSVPSYLPSVPAEELKVHELPSVPN